MESKRDRKTEERDSSEKEQGIRERKRLDRDTNE